MKSSKNYLIIGLALTTLGGAALAWRQYQELVELRAAAMDTTERAELQKKLSDLEQSNKELRDQLAAARGQKDGSDEMAADNADAPVGPGDNGGGRGQNRRAQFEQRIAAFRDLMAKPEVQAMVASERKSALDTQYAALFKSLNLSPEQADKLKELLVQRQDAQRDVFSAAREQGINPRTDPAGFAKLVADAQAPINDGIKSLLGDTGYNQLTNFDQTMPQRNVVNALQQRLSYSDTPLSSSQADQLVQILASNTPQKTTTTDTGGFGGRGGGDLGGMARLGGGFGGGGGTVAAVVGANAAPITNEAVNQAQTVLTQTQVAALQQLQQQQKTAQQLQQLMRSAAQQAAPAGGTTTGGKRGGG